ncbi:MAG: PAS domain-containing protein [Proteobacteria bacterium]|nr:PAS domain-containing protein [Pseudomonadota bacterium]
MPLWPDFGAATSAKINDLRRWWEAKRGARTMPDRADVDPIELKALLPYLLISECLQDPFNVRYRLVGTVVANITGFDITGRDLASLLPPDPTEDWMGHYARVYSTRLPVFGYTTVPTIHGDPFTYEFAIFPLSKGGDAADQFIALEDYGRIEPRLSPSMGDLTPWASQHARVAATKKDWNDK